MRKRGGEEGRGGEREGREGGSIYTTALHLSGGAV